MQGDDTVYTGAGTSPVMEGTWFNPVTKDSFTVRDTFIEGDEFFVISTDGRRFNADLIAQYIQCEDGQVPATAKPEVDVNQPEVSLAGIDPSIQKEADQLLKPVGAVEPIASVLDQKLPTTTARATQTPQAPVDEDDLFIKRLLSRVAGPNIKFSIDWKKYPTKQMEMLLDYMAVDIDKVCDYYIKQINMEEIRTEIAKELANYIAKQQEPEEETKAKPKK